MDPLSVTASVVGLLATTTKLVPQLYSLGTIIKDAPRLAQAAATELEAIAFVLTPLQTYIDGYAQASVARLSLITVEHITATLTGCVLTYSELDAVLKSMRSNTKMTAWDRTKWYVKSDEVQPLITRLQGHKASFTLMLNIIQCSSMLEAERSMDSLCDKISMLLRSDRRLSLSLRNIEDGIMRQEPRKAVEEGSTTPGAGAGPTDNSIHSQSSAEALDLAEPASIVHVPFKAHISAFEEQLSKTRVYRHASGGHSQSSLVDDGRSTLALSISSSLTLGEVSKIAMFALPIYAIEISNPDCYQFGISPIEPSTQGSSTREAFAAASQQHQSPQQTPKRKNNVFLRIPFRRKPAEAQEQSVVRDTQKVFGVALRDSIRYANVGISLTNESGEQFIYGYISLVVAKCGVLLKEEGTSTEHIFEVSSTPKRVERLRVKFDTPPRHGKDLKCDDTCTVHDLAKVLLLYILTLPEPVIPLASYDAFRTAYHASVDKAANIVPESLEVLASLKRYNALIAGLPSVNRQLLLYLLDLLAVFAFRSDVNKMDTKKLAGLFQPGILSRPEHRNAPNEYRLDQDILVFLIENQDKATAASLPDRPVPPSNP